MIIYQKLETCTWHHLRGIGKHLFLFYESYVGTIAYMYRRSLKQVFALAHFWYFHTNLGFFSADEKSMHLEYIRYVLMFYILKIEIFRQMFDKRKKISFIGATATTTSLDFNHLFHIQIV